MLFIHGIGHFHPENLIGNKFLESLDIGTNDEWILTRTGIHSRHTVLPLEYIAGTRNRDPRASDEASIYSNADTAFHAANLALKRAGLASSDIGMVIAGGSAPRVGAPAESCVIAERLGISAPSLDINSACSTFAVQMRMLLLMEKESLPDFVLVVNPENLTRTANYDERGTAILMGDCTTAAVVSRRVRARTIISRSSHHSDPSGWNKVVIPSAGHLVQDGSSVQTFAIRQTIATIHELRDEARGEFYFIGHQANLLMLKSACSRSGIAVERHLFNVDRRGNCGAAGAPSVLSENWEQFRSGDEAILAVVGAGLTWAGLFITFDE